MEKYGGKKVWLNFVFIFSLSFVIYQGFSEIYLERKMMSDFIQQIWNIRQSKFPRDDSGIADALL